MKISFEETVAALRGAEKVAILTHRRPDGDTLGSAAALCLGLRQLGKEAYLIKNTDTTPRFIAMVEDLWVPEGYEPGYICAVDIADRALFCPGAPEHIDLAIDHHPSFKDFGDLGYVDAGSAACGEIIYEILLRFGCEITKRIAEAVYTAVSTDTGCFCFTNTTDHTHEVAAACFCAGADWKEINQRCFRLKSKARVALEGYIYSTMRMCAGNAGAAAAVTRDVVESFGASEDDLENLSSLLTQIEGVKIGALLTETPERDSFKVSMRSVAGYNVSEVCAIFGGGGHAAAAGCTLKGMEKEEALSAIIKAVEDKINA